MKMMFLYILVALVDFTTSNKVYPPTKVIQTALAVSKAAYLPLNGKRFIRNGAIIENESSLLPRRILLLLFPPKYNPSQDKPACTIHGWRADYYEYKETEVLKFVHDQQKLVVFGFRGTEPFSIFDWLNNFDLFPGAFTIHKTTVTIHKGFVKRYNYIASWFEREYRNVPRNYSVVITGHSLGGASATIAAAFVAERIRRPDAVITFGSPYPGLPSFKKYYENVVGCNRTVRMEAKCDPFTRVPATIQFPGYVHACDAVKVNGRTGISIIKAHILYEGYEKGIKNKYVNINEVNFGCDQLLN